MGYGSIENLICRLSLIRLHPISPVMAPSTRDRPVMFFPEIRHGRVTIPCLIHTQVRLRCW